MCAKRMMTSVRSPRITIDEGRYRVAAWTVLRSPLAALWNAVKRKFADRRLDELCRVHPPRTRVNDTKGDSRGLENLLFS